MAGRTRHPLLLAVRLAAVAVAVLLAVSALPASAETTGQAVADSFAPDLLAGDNGLPTATDGPLRYGPISTPVDDHGDAIDAHTESVSYFDGSYYLYGAQWGCPVVWDPRKETPAGFCGFVTYQSDDLMNWHVVDRFDPPDVHQWCTEKTGAICGKPRVVYNARTNKYLMWFGVGQPIDPDDPSAGQPPLRVAESTTPHGPWTGITTPTLTSKIWSDFDITVGSDGNAYLVATVSGSDGVTKEIDVEGLDDDYTGTNGKTAHVRDGGEGVGIFQHGGHWYVTAADPQCGFCAGTKTVYAMATDPLGTWTDVPDALSSDSCGGEPHGVSTLPSPSGPVPVQIIDTYRTSPSQYPSHTLGDLNQAIAGRYWLPYQFAQDGTIKPFDCKPTTQIPLAKPVSTGPPPTYQVDCRATSTGSIEQKWTIEPGTGTVRIPVFQRTVAANPDPDNATDPRVLDAPLDIQLSASDGVLAHQSVAADSVSWAPRSVTLKLAAPPTQREQVTLRLTTQATKGCYGVLVGSKTDDLPDGAYQGVEDGQAKPAPDAQMLVRFDA